MRSTAVISIGLPPFHAYERCVALGETCLRAISAALWYSLGSNSQSGGEAELKRLLNGRPRRRHERKKRNVVSLRERRSYNGS